MRSGVLLALLALSGCTAAWWAQDADDEVADVLAEKRTDFDRFRAEGLADPLDRTGEEEAAPEPDLSGVPEEVGLFDALRVATAHNRDYQSQRESLYLSALALTDVRNDFSPFFTGSLAAVIADTNAGKHSAKTGADLGVSQILPTGGTLSVKGDADTSNPGEDDKGGHTLASGFTASLSQPLLRDAGYETSHESLTQAERNVVYAVRDFELYREDFTIDVMSQYYRLVGQLYEIQSVEQDLEARKYLMEQSEAKFRVNLATEVDRLRAQREYLRAEATLLEQKETYALTLDRFKILLGLPTSFPLKIRYEEPEFRPVRIELTSAVKAALYNRVDLQTERDRLEDSERGLRIAANRLLPDLDLEASYRRSAPADSRFGRQDYQDEQYTIGLTLNLPLERTSERNSLRQAMIDVDRAKRSLSQGEDEVILDVRNSLRSIRRAETSLEIRKAEIAAAEKEARAAQIRFEAGEMDNRNVTDARNAVLRARTAYITDLLQYEVSRIQLLRDVGVLVLDENGKWVEP